MWCLLSHPISAVITQWRAAIKEKKSHSPVVSCILTNRVNVGQLKSKIGWLQISAYFIINMNCPMCVLCYKLCSQKQWHNIIWYTCFSLAQQWNVMRVTPPVSDDMFTTVVEAFVKVSNFLEVNMQDHQLYSVEAWTTRWISRSSNVMRADEIRLYRTVNLAVLLGSVVLVPNSAHKCFQCCPENFQDLKSQGKRVWMKWTYRRSSSSFWLLYLLCLQWLETLTAD